MWSDEGVETDSSKEQCECERLCVPLLQNPWLKAISGSGLKVRDTELLNAENEIRLVRDRHASYLTDNLQKPLPSEFVSLDASRPWMCYWIVHALGLLDRSPRHLYGRIIATLDKMQNKETGGYGGGIGQMSHCAPTYAAVLCLCSIGTEEALRSINRKGIYSFFKRMKDPVSGAFRMHDDGEYDSRSTFTVICIARILNILTEELIEGTADYLLRCQTYEGGFGGEPGNEAHGGYNFCALASLLILQQAHRCDIEALNHWLLMRQMKVEGGFQGRTNKLVDSCYSFWQGSAFALTNMIQSGGDDVSDVKKWLVCKRDGEKDKEKDSENDDEASDDDAVSVSLDDIDQILTADDMNGELACNQKALQMYILHCAQNEVGGLRDKPGKSRDFYHSCYALSGLSIAQSSQIHYLEDAMDTKLEKDGEGPTLQNALQGNLPLPVVHGDPDNLLKPTSAVFNILIDKVVNAFEYFGCAWDGGGIRTEAGLLASF